MRKITTSSRARLQRSEAVRLVAYRDNATPPRWTIGWGCTFYPDGTPVKEGDSCTRAEADLLFDSILGRFERGVEQCVFAPLNDKMFGALVEMAYNVGVPAFAGSTLVRKLNAYDYIGAQGEFDRWVFSGGIDPNTGLVFRRNREQQEFNDGIREALAGDPATLAMFNSLIDSA